MSLLTCPAWPPPPCVLPAAMAKAAAGTPAGCGWPCGCGAVSLVDGAFAGPPDDVLFVVWLAAVWLADAALEVAGDAPVAASLTACAAEFAAPAALTAALPRALPCGSIAARALAD